MKRGQSAPCSGKGFVKSWTAIYQQVVGFWWFHFYFQNTRLNGRHYYLLKELFYWRTIFSSNIIITNVAIWQKRAAIFQKCTTLEVFGGEEDKKPIIISVEKFYSQMSSQITSNGA